MFGGSHPGAWESAAEAYRKGMGSVILVTGGAKPSARRHPTWVYGDTPEAHVIVSNLQALGVPREVIIFEARSRNTLENVLFARDVFNFDSIQRVLFVCKSYGAGRGYRTLKRNLPHHLEFVPYPFDTIIGDGPLITRSTWMDYPASRSFVYGEYLRIVVYGQRGDILPLETPVEGLEEYTASLVQNVGQVEWRD